MKIGESHEVNPDDRADDSAHRASTTPRTVMMSQRENVDRRPGRATERERDDEGVSASPTRSRCARGGKAYPLFRRRLHSRFSVFRFCHVSELGFWVRRIVYLWIESRLRSTFRAMARIRSPSSGRANTTPIASRPLARQRRRHWNATNVFHLR